jgi:hypothetical protein
MAYQDPYPLERRPVAHSSVISPTLVPDRRGAVAIMAGVKRDGDWIVPRLFRAFAFWGGMEIDLTAARLGPGVTQIEVVCIMGDVTILVPPELRVECEGDPIMASFEIERQISSTTSPEAPLIRVTGTAFWGSVEVKVIDPNAPDWLDRLGARWATLRGAR